MKNDRVGETLSKNLGPEWKITEVYRDQTFSVHHLSHNQMPSSASLVHIHDVALDTGTTFTVGDDNELRGNFPMGHLSLTELESSVGTQVFEKIKLLIDG